MPISVIHLECTMRVCQSLRLCPRAHEPTFLRLMFFAPNMNSYACIGNRDALHSLNMKHRLIYCLRVVLIIHSRFKCDPLFSIHDNLYFALVCVCAASSSAQWICVFINSTRYFQIVCISFAAAASTTASLSLSLCSFRFHFRWFDSSSGELTHSVVGKYFYELMVLSVHVMLSSAPKQLRKYKIMQV